jgi:hypothetical protein
MTSKLHLGLALALGCSSLATAASIPFGDLGEKKDYDAKDGEYTLEYGEDTPTSGVFGRSCAGDFDNDLVNDVAQMYGFSTTVWFAPSEFQAGISLGSGIQANDIETFRNATSADQLVSLRQSGLHLSTYNPTTCLFTHSILSANTHWLNAKLVRDADPTTAVTSGLIGVASNGTRLLLGATAPSWNPTHTFDLGTIITDVASIQWSPTPEKEIAVATTTGIRVYKFEQGALTQLADYPSIYTENHIAVLRQGTQLDRLAAVQTHTLPNGQFLGVVSHPSTGYGSIDEYYNLGDLGTSALTAADADGDGDSDLFLSNRMAYVTLKLVNARTPASQYAASFVSPVQEWIPLLLEGSATTPAPDNLAVPTVADLDNDGDGDLFQAVQPAVSGGAREIRISLGDAAEQDALKPVPVFATGPHPANGSYDLDVDPPAGGLPIGATHIQVCSWHTPGYFVGNQSFTLARGLSDYEMVALGTQPAPFVFVTNFPGSPSHGIVGMRFRYVRQQGTAIVRVWPSVVGLLSNSQDEFEEIGALPDSGAGIGPAADPETAGGFVPRPKIGPFTGTSGTAKGTPIQTQ